MVILTLHLHPPSTAHSITVFLSYHLAQEDQIKYWVTGDTQAGTDACNQYVWLHANITTEPANVSGS